MVLLVLFSFCFFSLFFDSFYLLSFFSFLMFYCVLFTSDFSFGGFLFFDGLSFFLVFLTLLIFFCCVFSNLMDYWVSNFFVSSMGVLCLIFAFLIFSFSCFSMLVFYVSFEFIFVLMFFFVLGWGYSPERLQASFYMVFYTLVVSFPFLVFLTLSGFIGFEKFTLWGVYSSYWWMAFFFVFLVKLPVYGVHLWLPKAHVEAPVSGSMVLAGVLLKLGGYGILRFSLGLGSYLSLYKGYIFSWGLVGGLLCCFLCLRQVDLKAYVAYSSVCHMGFGLAGFVGGTWLGYSGGILMMIGHGFCSSCMFYILFVFYERFYSRSGLVLKGVGFFIPLMSGIWFVFCVLNMGVPPSLSFFSEFMISSGILSLHAFDYVWGFFLLLFSGFYGIVLYMICCHGGGFYSGGGFYLSGREIGNFFFHFFYLLFMVFSLDYFFF